MTELFELRIQTAILGERSANEWPPRYTRWSTAARQERDASSAET